VSREKENEIIKKNEEDIRSIVCDNKYV